MDFFPLVKLTYSESVYFILLPVPVVQLYLHSKIYVCWGGGQEVFNFFILSPLQKKSVTEMAKPCKKLMDS